MPMDALTRGRRVVLGVVAGAALMTVGGLLATALVTSPAQLAADAGPPAQGALLATVERRVLAETVVMRATVVADQSVAVSPQPAAGAGPGGAAVVTRLPLRAGDPVRAGRVLAEVSGRPVFALHGALPVYRDLRPGAEGADVAQLQRALRELGYGSGDDRAGRFGPGTKAALAALYRALGYPAVPAVPDGGEAVRAAREAVRSARWALEDAQDAHSAATLPPEATPPADLAQVPSPPADTVPPTASPGLRGALSASPAEVARNSAWPGLRGANSASPAFEARVRAEPGARRSRVALWLRPKPRASNAGEAGYCRPRRCTASAGEAEMAPSGGRAGGTGGAGVAPSGGRPEGVGEVPRGKAAPAATARAVTRARESLADAKSRLATAEAAEGPMLPAAEAVFLRSFPARVASVTTRIGSPVDGPVLTLSAGELLVEAWLAEDRRRLLRPGLPVLVSSEVLGRDVRAKVVLVATERTTAAADPGAAAPPDAPAATGYRMLVRPDRPLPAGFAGQDVRLTVESAATDGAALVVPVTAVSGGADGRTAVTAVTASGARRRVEVRTGTSGNGYVEVVPLRPGTLSEGTRVVTGAAATVPGPTG